MTSAYDAVQGQIVYTEYHGKLAFQGPIVPSLVVALSQLPSPDEGLVFFKWRTTSLAAIAALYDTVALLLFSSPDKEVCP